MREESQTSAALLTSALDYPDRTGQLSRFSTWRTWSWRVSCVVLWTYGGGDHTLNLFIRRLALVLVVQEGTIPASGLEPRRMKLPKRYERLVLGARLKRTKRTRHNQANRKGLLDKKYIRIRSPRRSVAEAPQLAVWRPQLGLLLVTCTQLLVGDSEPRAWNKRQRFVVGRDKNFVVLIDACPSITQEDMMSPSKIVIVESKQRFKKLRFLRGEFYLIWRF